MGGPEGAHRQGRQGKGCFGGYDMEQEDKASFCCSQK